MELYIYLGSLFGSQAPMLPAYKKSKIIFTSFKKLRKKPYK
jgi:hypothetical protein